MIMKRRKHGSQRAMDDVKLEVMPNFVGQGGSDRLVLRGSDGVWYTLQPETMADVKELMSQAHIIHHNFTK